MTKTEVVKAILEELESAGVVKRTGEMRWSERCNEWQPVYAITELGKALEAGDIEQYLRGYRC
jgi:hypothetical protein